MGWPFKTDFKLILGPSWAILGPSRALLGPSWALLGPSWAHLGPSWAYLGPILAPAGVMLGYLGLLLGLSWLFLGFCWAIFSLFLKSWIMWSLSSGSFRLSVLCSQSSLGLLRSCAHTPRASSFNHGLCGRCPRALQPGPAECAKRLNEKRMPYCLHF